MKIPEHLNKLAHHVAQKAVDEETPFAETLDALGKLTTYYALLLKNVSKTPDEDDTAPTIGRMTERLRKAEEATNGRTGTPVLPGTRRG